MENERLELYRKIQPLITWPCNRIWDSENRKWYFSPPVYDPEHPERSLSEMIYGCLEIKRTFGMREWIVTVTSEQDRKTFTGTTLDIALLKAIVWQMEGEYGKG